MPVGRLDERFIRHRDPSGVLCVCSMLDKTDSLDKMDSSGRLLGLERFRTPQIGDDPREPLALGVEGNSYQPGLLRYLQPQGSAGQYGRCFPPTADDGGRYGTGRKGTEAKGSSPWRRFPTGKRENITQIDFYVANRCLGGQRGNGLKPETVSVCHRRVTIPMLGRAESLNASIASLLMWEMMRCAGEVSS